MSGGRSDGRPDAVSRRWLSDVVTSAVLVRRQGGRRHVARRRSLSSAATCAPAASRSRGTLDPAAVGVLPILIGEATKLMPT